MKRRITKKRIRKAEQYLAARISSYLSTKAPAAKEGRVSKGGWVCSALTNLLASWVMLEPQWNDKERWLDGIIHGHLLLRRPDTIQIRGEMVWGLQRDVGGHQWREPFVAVVKLSKSGHRLRSYSLGFSNDQLLSEKLVKSGLYSTLISEGEVDLLDTKDTAFGDAFSLTSGNKYKHLFSKHNKV